MGKRKKEDTAYRAAVSGAKGLLRFLVYILAVILIFMAGRAAYNFGYEVFDQQAVDEEADAKEVTVVIEEGDSVYQVGKILKENGLIEKPTIFWVQEKFSDYRGMIEPGTYILKTSQDVDNILEILARKNTEGQPAQDEVSGEAGEDSGSDS